MFLSHDIEDTTTGLSESCAPAGAVIAERLGSGPKKAPRSCLRLVSPVVAIPVPHSGQSLGIGVPARLPECRDWR